jgi:hypothetical protein
MATVYCECEFFNFKTGEEDIIEDIEVEVDGKVSPYVPAKLWGHPDTWAPAEGGEIDDMTFTLDDGTEITEEQFKALGGSVKRAEEALFEQAAECEREYRDCKRYGCNPDDF